MLRQNYFHEKEKLLNIYSSQKRSEEAFAIRRHECKYKNKVQLDGYTQEQEHEIRKYLKELKAKQTNYELMKSRCTCTQQEVERLMNRSVPHHLLDMVEVMLWH